MISTKKMISIAVTAATLLFGIVPASATTGTWATPTDLTTVGEQISDAAEIAVDSTGLATAVWTREEENGVDYTIRSSTSLNGGPWSTPINVSAVGEDNSEPKIAVDSDGLAIAVWVIRVGDLEKIQSSYRPRGGTWSTALDLSASREAPQANTPGMSSQSVTFDSTGLAIAVWNFYDSVAEKSIIQTSSRSPAGVWSGPSNLSNASENTSASGAKVAFNSSGVAFVVWETRDLTSNRYRAEIRWRSSEGTWSPISYVDSSLHHSWSPNVVVSSDGVVTIALVTAALDNSQTVVESVIRQPNGTFSDRQALSVNLTDAVDVKLAAGLNGSTIAVWFAFTGVQSIIQSATRSGVGVISGPIDLSDSSFSANRPDLAIDGNGLATAVWELYDGEDYRIQSTTLQNGSWSSAENLSAAGQDAANPKVAANASGRTVVVWEQEGLRDVVQSRASFQGGAWSNTETVSPVGRNSDSAQVVVDSNGLATVLFRTREYDSTAARNIRVLKARTSFRGGAWSVPVTVSMPGEEAFSPQLSMDSKGRLTVLYGMEDDQESQFIKSTNSFRGGAWTTPVILSQPGHEPGSFQVGADANGLATAVWSSFDGNRNLITSRTSLNGGLWSPPITLNGNAGNGQDPSVTADGNGLATAVWLNYDGIEKVVQSSKSLNGGTWSDPINLSTAGDHPSGPVVSVNAGGLVTAAWMVNPTLLRNDIESRTSLGSGAWSAPQIISDQDKNSFNVNVSVDRTGRSIAVWISTSSDPTTVVQSSSRPKDGTWSGISSLSAENVYSFNPRIVADGQGLATAIWSTNSGRVETGTSLSGGPWTSLASVSALNIVSNSPTLAVDPNGLVTAAWTTEGNTNDFIQASSIQNSAPSDISYSNWSNSDEGTSNDSLSRPNDQPTPSPTPTVRAPEKAKAPKPPSLSGVGRVSRTLAVQRQIWTGYPTPKLTYQWYACSRSVVKASQRLPKSCKLIDGATGTRFKLTRSQIGKFVTVVVTGASVGTPATTWVSKSTPRVRRS